MNTSTSAIVWASIMEMESKKKVVKTETSKGMKHNVSAGNMSRESRVR